MNRAAVEAELPVKVSRWLEQRATVDSMLAARTPGYYNPIAQTPASLRIQKSFPLQQRDSRSDLLARAPHARTGRWGGPLHPLGRAKPG